MSSLPPVDLAYAAEAMELLAAVLEVADQPAKVAAILSLRVRELTGARCVLLVQRLGDEDEHRHRLLGVSPLSFSAWAERALDEGLAYPFVGQRSSLSFCAGGRFDPKAILEAEGLLYSTAAPLRVAEHPVGTLLALGFLDEQQASGQLGRMQALATAVALALHTAVAFEQQEQRIDERTRELRAANEVLQLRDTEAKRIIDAAQRSRRALLDTLEEQQLAEEKLRASEERYRDLVENLNDVIFAIDTDGTISYASSAVERLTGFAPRDLLGRNCSEHLLPEDRLEFERCLCLLRESLDGPSASDETLARSVLPLDFRYLNADGCERWGHASSRLIVADGRVVGLRGVFSDITERKRTEHALLHRLRYEHMLSEVSSLAVAAENLETLQQRCLAILGVGMKVSRAYIFEHCAARRTMDNTFEWCAPGIEPQNQQLQGLPNDLLPWWVETLASGEVICYSDIEDIPDRPTKIMLRPQGVCAILVVPLFVRGAYVGFIGFDDCETHREWPKEDVAILRSIARLLSSTRESKEAERRLESERRQLLSVFDSIEEPIYVADPKTYEVLFANRALERALTQNPKGQLCYRAFHQLDAPCSFCTNALILAEPSKTHRWEYHNLLVDRTFSLHDRIIQWPDGRDVRMELAVDVTQRRRLEEQLHSSHRMEAIGRLAGGIAHDFNNLLAVILSYTSFAMESLHEDDPLLEDLQEVRGAGQRAAALTRQLLAFSRRQVLEPKVLDFNELLTDLERMLRRLIGEHIEVSQELAPNLWSVLADPGQLEQVVMNLVVNARDAMPEGGRLSIRTDNVELSPAFAEAHPGLSAGPFVQLTISDTGEGMTELTRQRLFEPFFTTKEQGKGTGLGLATVYGVVKQSGGNVLVFSELGKGSRFELYFPKVSSTLVEPPAKEARPRAPSESFTILVVEDEEAVRKVTARMLMAAGHRVLTAANGGEALLLCEQHPQGIDLLLTDVVMPQMSGRALAERLIRQWPQMSVLYMSGYTDNAIVHHGILDPGMRFIAKPFGAEELLLKVWEAVRKPTQNAR